MSLENQKKSEFLKCSHCGNYAPMSIASSYFLSTRTESYYPEDPPDIDYKEGYIYELLFCLACKNATLRKYLNADYLEDNIEEEILYPSQRVKLFYLPDLVREAYNAALKARNIDANAYAILLCRMLEMVCQDRKVEGENLYEKLKLLASNGEIPNNLVGVTHGLRQLRNISVHEPVEGLSEEEIPILDDLSRAVLEYIYIAPALARQAEIKHEELKAKKRKMKENKE